MTSKEKILDKALTLFAENGYDRTTVDQIAQYVGIKAPSLYKYFAKKEDILNALIDAAENRYAENFGSYQQTSPSTESCEAFARNGFEMIRFIISDPLIRKMRIFLMQEQFRNKRLATITSQYQIDGIQFMTQKIIEGMMQNKLFVKGDAAIIALQFIAPVTLLIAKADRLPDSKKECLKLIKKHIKHFVNTYKK